MEVCVVSKKDFNEVKGLFLDVFSNQPWNDQWESDEQLTLYLEDLMDNKNSLSLVLKDERGQIIGASLGYVFNWWEGREYFVKEFFIAKARQNKGVGSQFLHEINNYLEANKITTIWLATERNFPAYDFYNKNGFKELKDTVFLAKNVE